MWKQRETVSRISSRGLRHEIIEVIARWHEWFLYTAVIKNGGKYQNPGFVFILRSNFHIFYEGIFTVLLIFVIFHL